MRIISGELVYNDTNEIPGSPQNAQLDAYAL